jgi:hypothetical protein
MVFGDSQIVRKEGPTLSAFGTSDCCRGFSWLMQFAFAERIHVISKV